MLHFLILIVLISRKVKSCFLKGGNRMKYLKRIGALLIAGSLLCGCTANPGETEEAPVSSYIWETMPALEYGSLEYEKLDVQPWYCGRCEATGKGKWAETESGYYYLYDELLYYADKADLSTWVPVCNQPDCNHSIEWSYGQVICNAIVKWNSFILANGRIYSIDNSDKYPELKIENAHCEVLYSRAVDGTDRRREYYIMDTANSEGGCVDYILNYQYWLQAVGFLNPDGTYTQRLYCTTKDGEHLLTEYIIEDQIYDTISEYGATSGEIDGIPLYVSKPNGDDVFFTTVFGDEMSVAYRFQNGQLEAMDIMDYGRFWKYLSGDTLRIFRADDGIYDVNIRTKEEVKVADCAGKSRMVIKLPNCIIAYGTDGAMQFFDGQQWRDIQLPASLEGRSASIGCVASDRILFTLDGCNIYQVLLDQQDLTMEYCGTIQD